MVVVAAALFIDKMTDGVSKIGGIRDAIEPNRRHNVQLFTVVIENGIKQLDD